MVCADTVRLVEIVYVPAPPVPVTAATIVTNAGIPVPVRVCPGSNTPVTVPATVNVLPDIEAAVAVPVTELGTGCLLFNKAKLRISAMGY